MKNSILLLLMPFVIIISCTKEPAGNNNGNNPEKQPGNPIVKRDSGFVVIYTNSMVFTDPLKGNSISDAINVSVNNSSSGKIMFQNPATKIYYNTKNTVSLKLPIGNADIKGTTTSGVSRSFAANIIKNDTVKVNLSFDYSDPNKDLYYIEYYDNGVYKKYNQSAMLSKWLFYSGNHMGLYGTIPGCVHNLGYYNFDGPAYKPALESSPPSSVSIAFTRPSWKLKPQTGNFTYAGGQLDFKCGGAVVNCNIADSYAGVTVTDVKVIEDMGLEKRGYYSGRFDAVLYYSATFGNAPQKHIISQGKFFMLLGGIANN